MFGQGKPSSALLLLLSLLLCSCAQFPRTSSIPPVPVESATNPDWRARQVALNALVQWQLSGKINIRHNSRSNTARLNWRQNKAEYNINIVGPLGQGSVVIAGRPGYVLLQQAGKDPIEAASPELLISHQLGYQFPLSELVYWVRGLPAPGSRSQSRLDDRSQLIQLKQAGWQIDYQNYQAFKGLQLPGKIKLVGNNLQLTLLIKRWEI